MGNKNKFVCYIVLNNLHCFFSPSLQVCSVEMVNEGLTIASGAWAVVKFKHFNKDSSIVGYGAFLLINFC